MTYPITLDTNTTNDPTDHTVTNTTDDTPDHLDTNTTDNATDHPVTNTTDDTPDHLDTKFCVSLRGINCRDRRGSLFFINCRSSQRTKIVLDNSPRKLFRL